jgi:hypothetical protein
MKITQETLQEAIQQVIAAKTQMVAQLNMLEGTQRAYEMLLEKLATDETEDEEEQEAAD